MDSFTEAAIAAFWRTEKTRYDVEAADLTLERRLAAGNVDMKTYVEETEKIRKEFESKRVSLYEKRKRLAESLGISPTPLPIPSRPRTRYNRTVPSRRRERK